MSDAPPAVVTLGDSLHGIDACLLVGGLGTRLRGVLVDRPKPLAEVGGRPFVTYLLDQLAAAGVRRGVLCTGHLGAMIEEQLGRQHGALLLEYSHEQTPLGTGGAIVSALPLLRSPTVLVANGDSLCRCNLEEFAAFHLHRNSLASLLLAHVPDASRFGRVELDSRRRIRRFVEKGASANEAWINAGVYLFQRSFLETLPGGPLSLERDVFPRLTDGRLLGFPAPGPFLDIGTPESLATAAAFFERDLLLAG